jgi:hypothetical protein
MDKQQQDAIRARLEALGNTKWTRAANRVFSTTPSGKQFEVALTSDGLGKKGTVVDFIANAPSDIAALLDALDERDTRIGALEDACNAAFTALAKDNTYGPGPNKAWAILGEVLGKVHSDDEGGE